jgi:MFS family permease
MVNAYLVPFGGFLLLGGRAGDLLGRRRVLVAGTAAFALASLGSALAPSAGVMVGTRAAEGLAAAFIVPMTLALLSSVFPAGPGRNRAFAVWGGVSAAAGTLGLILGGVLITAVGWRWIFLVNLPVGALVVAAALRLLPADGPRPVGGRAGFDVGGALSVTAGTSLLAYAVVQTGSHPWGSARTIALLAVAAALIGYFLIHERFVATSPPMPLALWRNRSVAGANVVSALVASALFAVFYSTTLYLQQVLHYSALLARIPADGHLLTDIIVPTVAVGLGGGLMIVPTSIAAMSGVAAAGHGVSSALLNVSRQLGGALGLAVISAVVASATARSAAAGHGSPVALTAGFQAGFAISAALAGVSVLTAAALLREEGRGERVNLIELQAG